MDKSTIIGAAAGLAGALVIGSVAVANADTTPTPTPTPSQSQGTQGGSTKDGDCAGGGDHGGRHTAASAAETSAVKKAVAAKDSAITVDEVVKDADGSFDVMGTKAGERVRVEVSKDYATVTVDTAGRGMGGHGGRGHEMGTPVDAATLTKLQAAVSAKDSAVTLHMGMKAADGSYRAMGTKADARVMVEISADLKTVTVGTAGRGTGGPGMGRGGHHGGMRDGGQGGSQAPTSSPTASGAAYSA